MGHCSACGYSTTTKTDVLVGNPAAVTPDEKGHHFDTWQRAAEHARGEVIDMRCRKDNAYAERNRLVAVLAGMYPSGLARTAIAGWDPEWHNAVYIDLPTGQASWHYHDSHHFLFAHLPPYGGKWDGHTTEEKYERVARLTQELFVE